VVARLICLADPWAWIGKKTKQDEGFNDAMGQRKILHLAGFSGQVRRHHARFKALAGCTVSSLSGYCNSVRSSHG